MMTSPTPDDLEGESERQIADALEALSTMRPEECEAIIGLTDLTRKDLRKIARLSDDQLRSLATMVRLGTQHHDLLTRLEKAGWFNPT
jgi:hypothetical protein